MLLLIFFLQLESDRKDNDFTCPSRIDDRRCDRCRGSFDDALEFCSIHCSYPCDDCSWVDKFRSSDSDDCDGGTRYCRPSLNGREYFWAACEPAVNCVSSTGKFARTRFLYRLVLCCRWCRSALRSKRRAFERRHWWGLSSWQESVEHENVPDVRLAMLTFLFTFFINFFTWVDLSPWLEFSLSIVT